MANVQTTAFKKSKIEFQDVLYQTVRQPGAAWGGQHPPDWVGNRQWLSSRCDGKELRNGRVDSNRRPLQCRHPGRRFFPSHLARRAFLAYTRDGAFKLNRDGQIVTSDGLPLEVPFTIPDGTINLEISTNGTVSALIGGQEQIAELGQIQLFRFRNPAGLQSAGRNLYTLNQASGDPQQGIPGENGYGTLNQGAIEKSNVKVIEEMVNMIVAQRAFEVNSKAIKSADEMMSQTNNLKR